MVKIQEFLNFIYGIEKGREVFPELLHLMEDARKEIRPPEHRGTGRLPVDETDAILITYGDSLQEPGRRPLVTLRDFAFTRLHESFSGIHILPFFPYSSDDGFSIIDYYKVNPDLGTWKEVEEIGGRFKIMSDLVLNHCSARSEWFQRFLEGDRKYRNFFIEVDPATDLSMIFRPRTHPLLTPFESPRGTLHVWTTFSADQVDLNFAEPAVLLEMVRVLLFHVIRGIQIIRLDAIAFLWKEPGHPSIHHEKTHAVVKLFRALLEEIAPWVVILTETNVPHDENISYFGNMEDEAHMVYQFSLPPLVLDAFLRRDTGHLREWASKLPDTRGKTSFFNFLASHDGIGLLPARGILTEEEIDGLVRSTLERGGCINYKSTPQGNVPYEMNITYFNAVAEKELTASVRARKFLASQSIMLTLQGVPGIYIHSLLGSENFAEGVKRTGQNRTINREKLSFPQLIKELQSPDSLRSRIFEGFLTMLQARRSTPAFHPAGAMEILPVEGRVLAVLRTSPEGTRAVLALINVSPDIVTVLVPCGRIPGPCRTVYREMITGNSLIGAVDRDSLHFQIEGYGVYWLDVSPEG
jgi:sucrose phosphorylase